jgi:hypothetical protein
MIDRSKYPLTYGLGVYCGFWAPEEWDAIIIRLSERIERYLESHPIPEFRVDQVKEKFGGLRFYVNVSNEVIDQYILEAEIAVNELEKGFREQL